MDSLRKPFNPHKQLKEEFVSNLTGSSMLEIAALSAIVPILMVLRHWTSSNSVIGIWWNLCRHALPNLRELAIRVLSQPCSASACERNWSVFEVVHTKKRDRLEPGKLHDLVYVKLNLHLQTTSKKIQAKDSTPICIENLEGFPGMEVGDDPNVVNIEDDEDDELGDSEEEEDAFENIDFLNPSI